MRGALYCLVVLVGLAFPLCAQKSPKTDSSPLATGIARNQQELQELSTLIAQNNSDMRKILREVVISLTGAVAGAGPESAVGQSPREALSNLISAYQKVQSAMDTGGNAMDGELWLAVSGQLKLALDLIGEEEPRVRLASTTTDLLVKTAQLLSLSLQNAELVDAKVHVAQAQMYLLAKSRDLARSQAAQRVAAQSDLLPQIRSQQALESQWLQQQYKDRPQVIELAVRNGVAKVTSTASQIVRGLEAAGNNSDTVDLSKIPGINPDAIVAINRCNEIALTMVQRRENLASVLASCPKADEPGGDRPPCPAYEVAALENSAIDKSSMTCNKYADGQYIPFFGKSKGVSDKSHGAKGKVVISWPPDRRCSSVETFLVTLDTEKQVSKAGAGYHGHPPNCIRNDADGYDLPPVHVVAPGPYRLYVFYPGTGYQISFGGAYRPMSWSTELIVESGTTQTITPPRQEISFDYEGDNKAEPLRFWSICLKRAVTCLANMASNEGKGMDPHIDWGPIAPGNYELEFEYDPPSGWGYDPPKKLVRNLTVAPGQNVSLTYP